MTLVGCKKTKGKIDYWYFVDAGTTHRYDTYEHAKAAHKRYYDQKITKFRKKFREISAERKRVLRR